MTSEIAKAEWKNIKDLKHLGFTKTTRKICELLMSEKGEMVSESKLELCGLTGEEFKLRGTNNVIYSANHLMNKIAKL